MTNKYLNVIKRKTIEIAEEEVDIAKLGPEDIAGHTVFSMVSAGTEINACFFRCFKLGFTKKNWIYRSV